MLVVEDDGLVRFDTAETLRDAGFEVLEAGDAVEALAEVEQRGDIRLLFTDINMPGEMDGIQLARKVHQLHPAIQVLLTSGKVRPRNGEFPDDGDFIAKPYSAASMTRAVCRMLA
ncbi:MAG TPA: response regulator [Caulobacteraceae bacterium]|nr:response regulator [Caulobacteraceae bacterium]